MTVTVRPVPQRVARNGIRPFRPVVPTNNLGPVTVKNWRPPVPEPLPPAPLIGPRGLLALGALVLAQIWGLLGSRPKREQQVVAPAQLEILGTVPPPGNTVGATLLSRVKAGTWKYSLSGDCKAIATNTGGDNNWGIRQNVTSAFFVFQPGSCGPVAIDLMGTFAGSSDVVMLGSFFSSPHGSTYLGRPIELQWQGPGAVPYDPGTEPVPLPEEYKPPTIAPTPVIAPPLVPQPSPQPQPIPEPLPDVQPLAPPAPVPVVPAAPPATQPLSPVPGKPLAPPLPSALPGSQPTQDGAVTAPAAPPVPATPPDAHFPVPGAPPVTGNGPRPTPEGIAQELGRLEQKVARLSNPQTDKTGDATDRIGLALKLLGDVIEFFSSITAGGGYELSSPCEVDEAGQPIPVVVNFSGAPTALGVINNKIDAVAQLLQEHKNLKQPICRQTPAVGEPVTVQFVQVD